MNNTLTMFGGAIKTLGIEEIKGRRVGRLGGTLCLHSTANDPDATRARDYFDASTDFKMIDGMEVPVYFHHGLHERIGVKQIGTARIWRDELGVQIEAEIYLDDADGLKSYNDACAGKLGWSSGTAAHLVQRTRIETKSGRAHHITYWPLGLDASLTPTPAEPRNVATEIKSLLVSQETEESTLESALLDSVALLKMVDETEFSIEDGIKRFDPNQARDKDGKWSGGGTHSGLLQHTHEHVKPKDWHERTQDEAVAMFERSFAGATFDISKRHQIDNSHEHRVAIQHPKRDAPIVESVREPAGADYTPAQVQKIAIAQLAANNHRAWIEKAMGEGKPIPEHIARSYGLHPDQGGNASIKPDERAPYQKLQTEYVLDKQRSPVGRIDQVVLTEQTTQNAYEREHRKQVEAAVERQDYVPRQVLADYPDLADKVARRYSGTRQEMKALQIKYLQSQLLTAQVDMLRSDLQLQSL
jgi:hypothetical protein